jgi:hypothetical protein
LVLSLASGCATTSMGGTGFGFADSARSVDTRTLEMLEPGSSDTEREARRDHAEREARAGDDPPSDAAIKGSFWTGVIAGSIGGAMAVGFGTAGAVTTGQVEKGFEDGTTVADHDAAVSRGETFNALTITGIAVGVVGLGVAAIAAGIDRTRCGPLKREKTGCTPR